MKDKLPDYFNKGEDIIKIDSGGVFNFFQGDNLELYERHLKTQSKDWYYRTNDVIYDINSYGYRTKEFDEIIWKNAIVLFGCSITFGVGVTENDTISSILSQKFNRNVINMGIGGASNELILYNSLMLKRKYGIPYGVIFLWTGYERTTYFGDKSIKHLGSWNHRDNKPSELFDDNLYRMLETESSNTPIKTYYSIVAAQEVWKPVTKYYDGTYFDYTAKYGKVAFLPFWDDRARDLSHPGRESLRAAANIIYEHYE